MKRWPRSPLCQTPSTANGIIPLGLGEPKCYLYSLTAPNLVLLLFGEGAVRGNIVVCQIFSAHVHFWGWMSLSVGNLTYCQSCSNDTGWLLINSLFGLSCPYLYILKDSIGRSVFCSSEHADLTTTIRSINDGTICSELLIIHIQVKITTISYYSKEIGLTTMKILRLACLFILT